MLQRIHDPRTMRTPVLVWADDLDEETRRQALNLANLPIVHHHVALMADAHAGIGATIGSVFGARGALVPSAVGVDIGCGMCAIPTGARANEMLESEALYEALQAVFRDVPLGFAGHKKAQPWQGKGEYSGFGYESANETVTREIQNEAPFKLGSLGGGNHFIEFQRGEDGQLWIMVHSGSRNVGLKIANFYMKMAQRVTARIDPSVPKDLSWLPEESPEGLAYIDDMTWALAYAFENRLRMIRRTLEITQNIAACHGISVPFDEADLINIHHNYAAREEHFGARVWVHRKGATLATRNTTGIIPGSMGAHSYIVRGLGNRDSFESCSHGAGRAMSRSQARRNISQDDLREGIRGVRVLHKSDVRDEAPQAYKKIDSVMSNQRDLVEILHELSPLGVIKG